MIGGWISILIAIDTDGTHDAEDDDSMTNSSCKLYRTCVLEMLETITKEHAQC